YISPDKRYFLLEPSFLLEQHVGRNGIDCIWNGENCPILSSANTKLTHARILWTRLASILQSPTIYHVRVHRGRHRRRAPRAADAGRRPVPSYELSRCWPVEAAVLPRWARSTALSCTNYHFDRRTECEQNIAARQLLKPRAPMQDFAAAIAEAFRLIATF